MQLIVEEYGMLIIAIIAFMALCVLLNMFHKNFKGVSQVMIADMTGVPVSQTQYTHYNY